MKAGMFMTEAEEMELRVEYGYNDEEVDLVNRSRLQTKIAEDMRAQAAQSAMRRKRLEAFA